MKKNIFIGAGIVIFLFIITCFTPLLPLQNPKEVNVSEKLQGVSSKHLMGTDQLGRDMFSRVLYGSRVSLTTSFVVVILCMTVGTIVGCIAGYFGGIVDILLMRIVDIMMAFPSIILPIAITGIMGPSIRTMIFALSVTSWVGYARMCRSSVLMIKQLAFIDAAKAMGRSQWQIIKDHILPHAVHPLIVYATFNASHTILAISGLSFIGLGVHPPTPEWGSMLNDAKTFMGSSPHLFIFPGLMIMITVLGLNLLGDGLRDYMDPRLRKEVDL